LAVVLATAGLAVGLAAVQGTTLAGLERLAEQQRHQQEAVEPLVLETVALVALAGLGREVVAVLETEAPVLGMAVLAVRVEFLLLVEAAVAVKTPRLEAAVRAVRVVRVTALFTLGKEYT
jgi:hypothetical protein